MQDSSGHRPVSLESHNSQMQKQRLKQAHQSMRNGDRNPDAYIKAARYCKQLGQLHETLEILRQGIARCAPSESLHEYYIERLEKCNRTEAAIEAARQAATLFPDQVIFRLREALTLPILYDTQQQIDSYRRRFAEGLQRIIREVPLETPGQRESALSAIGRSSNKYLPYQGQNDRDLQVMYGGWVQRVMEANYPQRSAPDPMPPVDGKIRVGYLTAFSGRFLNLSAAKLFGGWIRELDREQFEVFAYHADRADGPSEEVLRWNIPFRQFSGNVGEIAATVRADRLHVLIYLDFGIHPRMAQLAALRLAPIQCVAWDTPLTSGMPAMDYFLSSDLMEPDDGQEHYSEELIRLPGVGVSFIKPVIPAVLFTKVRRDFGLRDNAVVYLCCQSIFKYSPAQDDVVVRIARQVPEAEFVFLTTNELAGNDLRARMERAFAAADLSANESCVFLGEMDLLDYWNLHQVGDVCLDTLGWSGGVTTFEAIACGLPVVTLPGRLMRARHSSAILRQLGVMETVASDTAHYVDIAVRLGLDRKWRKTVLDRMAAGYQRLYSDTRSIRSLEEFVRGITNKRFDRSNTPG